MKAQHFLPASTFGQTALLMAAALAIAQLLGFFLLVNERQRASLLENVGPAMARFADMAQEMDVLDRGARPARLGAMRRFDRRYALDDQSLVSRFSLPRESNLEQRLARALDRAGTSLAAIEASNQAPPLRVLFARPDGPPRRMPQGGPPDMMIMDPPPPPGPDAAEASPRRVRFDAYTFSVRLSDGQWLNAVYRLPRRSPDFLWRLAATTAILYVGVLAAALFIAYRLSRPFRALTNAAESVGVGGEFAPLAVHGPADVRAAIEAFNAMALRVSALLQEKDAMLGAIGHDLRTPLASLRIRAENMEPAAERERAIDTLNEMSRILEDILELSRLGRSSEAKRLLDLSALADAVVEEFRALGKAAAFTDSPRAPVACQRSLTARLIRNLIENAVKFAGAAQVSVRREGGDFVLAVEDDGPGVPDEALAQISEAFVRGERSRNRETGGAGLGLAIAKAIAASQGARLELSNRSEGGFAARVRWPAA